MTQHTIIDWKDSLSLATGLEQAGGFTYRYGLPTPTTGYMVSIDKFEHTFLLRESDLTKEIDDYLNKHFWYVTSEDDLYIGGWLDANTVFLDISLHFDSEEDAVCYAKANNQLAYYDLSNGDVIMM
jgi:hypothetical protein